MPRGVRFVGFDLGGLIKAYLAGESADAIAKRCGSSRDTVYRLLKAQGVALRVSGRRPLPISQADIVRFYQDGWTVTDLARRYGCGRSSIDKRLKDAGAKLPASRSAVRLQPATKRNMRARSGGAAPTPTARGPRPVPANPAPMRNDQPERHRRPAADPAPR